MGTWRSIDGTCYCDECTAPPVTEAPDPAKKRQEAGLKNHLGTPNRYYVMRLLFQQAQARRS